MRAGLAGVELLDVSAIAHINALGDELRDRLAGLGYRVNGRGSLMRVLDGEPDTLYGGGCTAPVS